MPSEVKATQPAAPIPQGRAKQIAKLPAPAPSAKKPPNSGGSENLTQKQPQQQSGNDNGQAGSLTQGAGSIAQIGGTGNQATVNNYAPPQRRLSQDFISKTSKCLSEKIGVVDLSAISGNVEAFKYAQDWLRIFSEAKWKLQDNIIGSFWVGGGVLPTETIITIKGTWNEEQKQAIYDSTSAQGLFVKCVIGKTFLGDKVQIATHPDLPTDTVRIQIDPQPTN
jgi:hypothetical protein